MKSRMAKGCISFALAPAFAGVTLMVSTAADAETIAIRNGTVCSGASGAGCKSGMTVIIRDDKIIAVGSTIAVPNGTQVIDATGKYVTPGLIDAYSRLGMLEVDAEDRSTDTGTEKSRFSAAFDAQWALNPNASAVAITRLGGVTRAAVLPEANDALFGGYGALVSTDSQHFLTRPRAFQVAELGESGADIAGGSRGASYVAFTNALREAAQLGTSRRSSLSTPRDALTNRLDAENLYAVVTGQVPLVIHVERVADIRNVIRLKAEFSALRPIIAGADEGWLVAGEIASARIPVIVQAFENLPDSFEKIAATMANAARLKKAGVTVALGSFDNQQNVRLMNQFAGNLTSALGADTLSEGDALELITSAPARVLGMDTVGTLEAGKLADIVIWDGPPLEMTSAPVQVMIAGRDLPMVSRQTLLRDRYKTLTGQTPFQYRK